MSELNTQQKASSTDLVAKLLATENITVMRRSVSTACFDLQQRILTLPTWKEMNDQEELMLVLHECSHALFTTYEKFKTVFTDQAELRDYANVLEDMRAESKMKLRYPGSRKMFFDGYRSLNERDFFGVKMHSLEALPLIDRLNLYYKVGGNCGVKFSKDEMVFLNRAERLNTEDEVIALAREIYEFAKAKRSHEMAADISDDEDTLANQPGGSGDDGEEEDEDFDSQFADSDESGESDDEEDGEGESEGDDEEDGETESGYGGGAGRGEQDNDPLESVTQRAFNSKLDDLADNSVEIRYFEPVIGASNCVFNPIVPYKAVLAEFTSNTQHNGINAVIALPSNKAAFNQWKSNNASMVNYLVKEFEMKKAATAYKRTSIAKTGQLDCKKLFAYKLKEDLFKQISQVKDGKKHGMLMLLDWSGSMNEHMAETVNQVMALASFCQRIQIPYEVYAFSDGYACDAENSAIRKAAFDLPTEDQITNPLGFRIPYFNLVQLYSNRMTGSEFNKMSEYLFNKPWYNASSRRASFGLNGTPLNEALLYMAEYAGQFKRNNSVEKLSFVTLTDGSGAGLYPAAVNKGTRISNGYTYDYESNTRKRIISTLRDPITKKQYSIDETAHSQTAALLKVIKDRYEANMVGFFITANSKNVIYRFLCTVTSVKNNSYSVGSLISSLRVKISSELSKNKCSVLSNAGGYDELYILNANIKIADGEIGKINDKMTSTQISRLLTKSLNTSKTSRIVLDRFITKIA